MPVADGGVRVNAERSRAAEQLRRRLLAGVVAGIVVTAGIAIATLAASTSDLVHQQLLDRMEAMKDDLPKGPNGVPYYTAIDGETKFTCRLKSTKKVSLERSKVDE